MTSLLASPDNIRVLERQAKKVTTNVDPIPSLEFKNSQIKNSKSPALNTRKLKE